jgi:uncharacterized protein YjbI with pentapeptide repeats
VAPKKFVFNRRAPELPNQLPPFAQSDAPALHAESAVLDHVSLADRTFASIVWKDVRLVSCDLANLETRHLTLVRVEFIDCRMTGLRAGVADCQDVLISEGDQRYSQFRYSKFRSSEFNSCNFEEADFQGTDLSGSIFRKCNLKNAEMSKVKLQNADLRGSQIEGLHLNAEDVRGAIVDLPQAMIFAGLLGIRIE